MIIILVFLEILKIFLLFTRISYQFEIKIISIKDYLRKNFKGDLNLNVTISLLKIET